MEEQIINFKTAMLAKDRGFKSKSRSYWINGSLPTQTIMQKWLREKHNVDVEAYMVSMQHNERYLPIPVGSKEYTFRRYINGIPQHDTFEGLSESYEEALEIGLQRALSELPIK